MLRRLLALLVGVLGSRRPLCQCGGMYDSDRDDDLDDLDEGCDCPAAVMNECPERGHTFFCPSCLTYRSWCFGCDDDDPYLAGLCDDCWSEMADSNKETHELRPPVA